MSVDPDPGEQKWPITIEKIKNREMKLQFLINKISNIFLAINFFKFLVITTMDLDPKMLDPDRNLMNPDPKHCF